jgi:hypothetical protein
MRRGPPLPIPRSCQRVRAGGPETQIILFWRVPRRARRATKSIPWTDQAFDQCSIVHTG